MMIASEVPMQSGMRTSSGTPTSAKAFVEHRHQDRAAADAEHAGQKSRQRADRDQQQGEFD